MEITLHAASGQVRQLLDQIDPETGELPPEYEQARAIVATKATAVAAYLLEEERQADMVDAYAKDLSARVRSARKRSEWLRQYLGSHMAACGLTEIRDERGIFTAKLERGRDAAVEVFDLAQVPADYMREIPATSEPDKVLMKRAIKDGFDIPGVKIVRRDRLTIK